MSRLLLLSLVSLAACTDPRFADAPDAPDPGTAGEVAAPRAHVRVHTLRPEVIFSDASGTTDGKARTIDGVATGVVPRGSTATAPVLTGHVPQLDGPPRTLRSFDAATSLADGDEITLGAIEEEDLAPVTAILPPAPAGAKTITAYWCGRSAPVDGTTIALDRTACGKRRGALFVAVDGAPIAALRIDDLDREDVRARAWAPVTETTVTLSPAPSASRAWTVRTGAILDGETIALGDERAVSVPTATVPVFAGGAVIATADDEPGEAPTLDEIAIARADASPFTIDLATAPFPALRVRATSPRSFALDGDVDAARDALAITADLASDTSLDTWHIALRGRDRAFTVPALGDVDAGLEQVELTLRDVSPDRIWIRSQPFFVP